MNGRLSDHLETELKFDAGPDFVIPDLSALASGLTVTEPAVSLLVATYYDTADLRLAGAHITLRRRSGGGDEGWHLKLPADEITAGSGAGHTRRELHEPLGQGDTVPPRFQAAVSRSTKGQPLGVVAVLETRRTVRNLVGADGAVAAELADDLVTGRAEGPANAASEPVTWREIEIELVSGSPGILAAAASALEAAGARRSVSASKLARLLGSPAAQAARQPHPPS
jgi:inorganic triphosphatase YgiF